MPSIPAPPRSRPVARPPYAGHPGQAELRPTILTKLPLCLASALAVSVCALLPSELHASLTAVDVGSERTATTVVTLNSEEPSPDRDGDGFPDTVDRCPSEPEGDDGFMDGCPGKPPRRTCPYAVSAQIRFPHKNKADVDRRSLDDLPELVRFLNEHPQYRLEIGGHAAQDESGSTAAQYELSLRRARAVRDYLVRKLKVSPARLEIRGYGATVPFPCGSGDVDPRDRRVDFMVLVSPPRAYSGPLAVD